MRALSLALALVLVWSCGPPAPIVRDVSAETVLAAAGESDAPVIVDVRTPGEYAQGHVPGAINVPYTEIGARLDELDAYRDRGVVLYCKSGRRAGLATETLVAAGFPRIDRIEGHMAGWRERGLPIER